MNPIQPMSGFASGAAPTPNVAAAPVGGAGGSAAVTAGDQALSAESLNVTLVYSQVDAMLGSIGGELQGNQMLRLVIGLLILQALLAADGGGQQAGSNALLDLLGLSGANRSAESVGLHSATNVVQIQQQSTVLLVGQAALAPEASESDPGGSQSQIDLSA